MEREDDLEPDFPTTGTFRSSWWPVFRWAIGVLLLGPALMLSLLWLDGEQLDGSWAVLIALFGIGFGAFFVIRYQLFGTRSVEIAQDHIEAVPLTGRPLRLHRDSPFTIQFNNGVLLVSEGRRLRVRDEGFPSDTWSDLTLALMHWKRDAPLSSYPDVILPQPTSGSPSSELGQHGEVGDAVYVAQHDKALFWGFPFFVLVAAVGLLSSWESYGDGTWKTDPMMSVALPVIGLGFCALSLWTLPRLVRRVAFQPGSFIIERFVGKPIQLPYGAVTDAFGEHLRTTRGRFMLGQRNDESFTRLLLPRLEAAQLSGEMLDDTLEELDMLGPNMVALLLIGLVLPLVLMFAFDFSESWATFSMVIGLVVMGVGAIVLQRLRAARRRRFREGR